RSYAIFEHLASDPRLAVIPTPRPVVVHRVLKLLPRLRPVPFYMLQALVSPKAARKRLRRLEQHLRTLGNLPASASPQERLDAFEHLLLDNTATVILNVLPLIGLVLGLPTLLSKLLGNLATGAEQQ